MTGGLQNGPQNFSQGDPQEDPLLIRDRLTAWQLKAPRLLADTYTSRLYRVGRADGTGAILKLLKPEGQHERAGFVYLAWRDGSGAVRLLAQDADACLLEDAGATSLADLHAREGDRGATPILSALLPLLHAPSRQSPPADLVPLERHFRSLFMLAGTDGPHREMALWATEEARDLLASEARRIPLHGDLHHDNVLQGADRRWRAIDPQGLIGDPAYEVANLFGNPSGPHLFAPERVTALAQAFAPAVGSCSPARILRYGGVHAMLSVAWSLERPDDADAVTNIRERLAVAGFIRSQLARAGSLRRNSP
ncbi:aminoglycoside phosphotransferase family protein [Rhizobium sp. SSA_523]|uniref:aminoglycoside phosphotransferase family protein n=1 Tax=Rhizobium sp. SSA_523 TaxID=2952477 RepID=UPI00209186CF|nr:aminoglycoside phosphotransferase family protein [Rhizobium sp. SSA_523]MCO5730675.1 phosphotransferase [Rhizobium sp. SSA_523]WKC24496.1 aminoglycoside phosphotransferase family protein [Rhizobium sp. SSA_523]